MSSSTLKLLPGGENILESCNNDYWRPAAGKSGEEAEIIIDLKCPMRLEGFSMINGFGDFGTEKFALFGSRNSSGPWTELYRGELLEGVEMTEEVIFIIMIKLVQGIHSIFRIFTAVKMMIKLKQLQQQWDLTQKQQNSQRVIKVKQQKDRFHRLLWHLHHQQQLQLNL